MCSTYPIDSRAGALEAHESLTYWQKTAQVVTKLFIITLVFLGTLLGNVITLGIPTLISLISRVQRLDIRKRVEERQMEHLQESFHSEFDLNELSGEQADFVAKVLEWKRGQPKQIDAIEHRLKQFVRDPALQQLKEHPVYSFLKEVALRIRSANVSDLLVQYAKEKLGDPKDQGDQISDIAKALRSYRKKPSFAHNFFWAISHPLSWIHSLESQWLPNVYNSHASNPTYTIFQDAQFRFVAGPSPINDPIYDEFLKENEVRFNIMDTGKKEEKGWIEEIDQKGHPAHIVWGFGVKKAYLHRQFSAGAYKDVLLRSRYLAHHTGLLIPKIISDQAIEEACRLSEPLFINFAQKSLVERHAVLVAVDTLISIGVLLLQKGEKNVAVACKQCFDRGPIYLASLLLFYRSLHDDSPLREEEFFRIAGIPLFRAPLNEGRAQMEDKFEVYEKLLDLLDMKQLAKITRGYRDFLTAPLPVS